MVNMSKPTSTGTATKTKKPSVSIQTNAAKNGLPSSSPLSASKRLPGSAQAQTTPITNGVVTNGTTRPSRRGPRLTARISALDNQAVERRTTIPPEPYVVTEEFILKKFKGKPSSLIVHLYSTYFRFDQQEGSFGYNSEMKFFIEHLRKGTIPHDLIEDFRREGVKYYDGWLIVQIVDHKNSAAADSTSSNGAGDEEKPFSIHNYNHFITPSPYAKYPDRDRLSQSPRAKHERNGSGEKENVAPSGTTEQSAESAAKTGKPRPLIFRRALKPTNLSKHMDLQLDFIALDPKARKPPNKAAQPPTPAGTVPPTPSVERAPPAKRQKTRIDPKDHLEYEARTINATAPPLYLEPAMDMEDAERIHKMLADPLYNEPPPSPKSRKRTVAELAAEDAHAKEQENFMLVMDVKGSGTATGNAGTIDPQAGNVTFQPRFERFNALDNIKRDLHEKKQRENEKRLQEDEQRRSQQQQHQEEERKRRAQQDAIEQRKQQAIQRQQQQNMQQQQQIQMQQRQNQDVMAAQQQAQQQQQANAQPTQRRPASQAQPSAIPPNMQNQIMAAGSSPIIRQGTPQNIASSPATINARPMVRNGSQPGGAGSPPRPGSAVPHGHPSAAGMIRQQSNQGGPSRNGTPQIPNGTPAMNNATPILRQGTPAHTMMTQASPVNAMTMGTPQMNQATMQGQIPNGIHPNMNQQVQMAAMQRQQMQQRALQQQQQMNGGQQMTPQMMQNMAQQRAQMAQLQQQRDQAAMQGTPQPQHMSPAPNNNQQNYNAQLRKTMMQQMGQQGSPAPNGMSPQQVQQMMQLQQQQQQQQQAMQNQQAQHPQQGQPQRTGMPPQMATIYQNMTMTYFKQAMTQESQKYGGNPGMIPPQVKVQLQQHAQKQAQVLIQKRMQQQQQQQQAQQQQMGQQQNPMMGAGQQGHAQMMGNPNMQQQMANMQNPQMQAANQQFQQNQAYQMQQQRLQSAQAQMQQNYQAQMQQMANQMANQQGGPR